MNPRAQSCSATDSDDKMRVIQSGINTKTIPIKVKQMDIDSQKYLRRWAAAWVKE